MEKQSTLMTEREVLEFLGINGEGDRPTLKYLRKEHGFPYIRIINGKYMYVEEDVRAWVLIRERQEAGSVAKNPLP